MCASMWPLQSSTLITENKIFCSFLIVDGLKMLTITPEQTLYDDKRCYYQTSDEVYRMHVERNSS